MTTIKNDLLVLAKQQIFNELISSRTKEIDNWMVESSRVWKEQGVIVPAPKFMVFPTQEEIIARAEQLSKQLEPTEETNEKDKLTVDNKQTEAVVEKVQEEVKNQPTKPAVSEVTPTIVIPPATNAQSNEMELTNNYSSILNYRNKKRKK
jgi:hypothetical protein